MHEYGPTEIYGCHMTVLTYLYNFIQSYDLCQLTNMGLSENRLPPISHAWSSCSPLKCLFWSCFSIPHAWATHTSSHVTWAESTNLALSSHAIDASWPYAWAKPFLPPAASQLRQLHRKRWFSAGVSIKTAFFFVSFCSVKHRHVILPSFVLK